MTDVLEKLANILINNLPTLCLSSEGLPNRRWSESIAMHRILVDAMVRIAELEER